MRSCNDVMTKNPTCCLASESVQMAAQIMRDEDIGSVPVVQDADSRRLVGIVTDRDLAVKVIADGKDSATVRVEETMTRNPVTCRPEENVQKAMDAMSQHQVRRIPIVDGSGRIVGIIAQADLAVRMEQPEKTENVLESISQPVG